MKAKLLMMVAIGASAFALGSCSENPAEDFPKDVLNIRQLRLDAIDNNNGSEARSSENPVSSGSSLKFATVDASGNPIMIAEDQPYLTTVSFVKPTNALMAFKGDEIAINFTPGRILNNVTVKYFDGTSANLTAETTECKFTVPEFTDGATIEGLQKVLQDGSEYNYTGEFHLWHYHHITLSATCQATNSSARTMTYDAAANVMVRQLALDQNGAPILDENGNYTFQDQEPLYANPGDKITISYVPAQDTDMINITLPDGEEISLSKASPSFEWTANDFGSSADIAAQLIIKQTDNTNLSFSSKLTVKKPVTE